jgi:ABC-type transport system involved in cytochrome bd biosynthesis fused ATPase/permease subunit
MNIEPGTILIFGVVMLPVYMMLVGWFAGKPRELRMPLLGVGILASVTVGLWAGLAVLGAVVGLIFF